MFGVDTIFGNVDTSLVVAPAASRHKRTFGTSSTFHGRSFYIHNIIALNFMHSSRILRRDSILKFCLNLYITEVIIHVGLTHTYRIEFNQNSTTEESKTMER